MDLTPYILYEDEHVLALNKPAGLVVHPDGRTKEDSVSEWFGKKYPESKDVGEPIVRVGTTDIERPGVVHRIDRDTSGVLLLAKTEEGFKSLKSQFKNREIKKTYHLFVHGTVKDNHGSIKLSIGKSASDFRKWSAERGARGVIREALTHFRVLARGDNWTFVEAEPKTGRTHQIRVHFKALHNPVVGDHLYARTKPAPLGFKRLALHAKSLTFHNVEGKEVTVEAPYPEDFEKALKELGV